MPEWRFSRFKAPAQVLSAEVKIPACRCKPRRGQASPACRMTMATSLPNRCCLERHACPVGMSALCIWSLSSLPLCIVPFSMQSPLICSSIIVTASAQRTVTLAWVSGTFLRVGTCTSNETDVLRVALAEPVTGKQSVE